MEESDVYVREEGDRPMEHSPRGRYIRFDIRLGTGAYKSVYKAYDTDQGIDVAWNAIDIGLLPSTEKTRIIQEVQLLQKLEHKNIINFYGSWFSKEKNQVVFITEIMTSGTLKSYIKRVQFIKWKIIKRWCIQILEGLHYLHSQNPPVIHRDLKCDNIFVNGNTGDLRIGDLGLSTQLAVDKRSKAQSVLGTPEFMAPELYDEKYDEKVDIYAFGMCVLEMVTKEVPYSECINPAQIYKKVTAGIRPRGLQRVVSQAARDFIELCLSRGNGLVDVTAQYLLDHPFLKAQDDDNDMVECLGEDELERESKEEQQRLGRVAEESFAVEFNLESGSNTGAKVAVSERRTQFPSLTLESQEMSGTLMGASSTSAPACVIASEEKTTGTNRLIMLPVESSGSTESPPATNLVPSVSSSSIVLPTQSSTPPPELVAATSSVAHSSNQPVISEMDQSDGPVSSEKKNANTHVDQFLATLPGTESAIQNTRINIMGGRGQRLDLENDTTPEYAETPAELPVSNGNKSQEASLTANSSAHISKTEPPHSAPGLLTPSQAPSTQVPDIQLPEREIVPASNHVRRASIQLPPDVATSAVVEPVAPTQPSPLPPPPQTSQQTNRKRVKRHEIKAAKDPDNEHSILLNLRIMIDGKSKEIKFPFNLFADSTHEVACELAVDVGILEPDLEDIADSIRFLVTEGKINNLPDVQEDVWEEAPEPHSFSTKPFPNVSKMSFVHVPPGAIQQQQQAFMRGAGSLERAQGTSTSTGVPASVLQSVLGTGAASPATQDLTTQESLNIAQLNDPSSTLIVLDGSLPLASNNSTGALPSYSNNELGRSPPRPGMPHSASESTLTKETLLSLLEMRARGVSMGSLTDPAIVQQIHQLEDRLKIARTAFGEQESSLEAAIRSEEEKHKREIERFRKKMEEFDKQRAAIARQQNGESAALNETNGSSIGVDERLFAQGETFGNTNPSTSSALLEEYDDDVGLSVDRLDEKSSLPPSVTTSATAAMLTSQQPQINASTIAAASPVPVPVDELIPESYLQSAGQSRIRSDSTPKTSNESTSAEANQPATGQSS